MEKFRRYAFLIVLIGIAFSAMGITEISKGPTSSAISRQIPIQTPYSVSSVENRTRELESSDFVVGTDSYDTRRLIVNLTNKDPDSDRIAYSFHVKEGSINVYVLDSENYTLWTRGLPYVAETRLDDAAEGILKFLPKSPGIYYLIYDNSSDPKRSKSVSDNGKESWTVTTVETRYRTEYETEVQTIYDYGRVWRGYATFLPGLSLFVLGVVATLRSRIGFGWRIGRKPLASTGEHVREMPTHMEPRPQPTVRIIPLETPLAIDSKVFEYIAEHKGVISLSEASGELEISIDELRASIERLKKEGKIE